MTKNFDDIISIPDIKEIELSIREYLITTISILNSEATKTITSEAIKRYLYL